MRRTSFQTMHCSIARTLDVVGDPWTLLVVREALFGTTRFDDFRRNLGIPRATLSARLSTLVDHGVLDRRTDTDTDTRTDTDTVTLSRGRPLYRLTPRGRALAPVMVALMQWGDEWSGVDEPPVTLVDLDTDTEIEPVYVDRRTGTPLHRLRIGRRINA
jgi:DNA-binding HxlR family transcriptional regulator